MDEVISWLFLDGPSLEPYEKWILDPKNKPFIDELKESLKEKAHIRIDLDELEEMFPITPDQRATQNVTNL